MSEMSIIYQKCQYLTKMSVFDPTSQNPSTSTGPIDGSDMPKMGKLTVLTCRKCKILRILGKYWNSWKLLRILGKYWNSWKIKAKHCTIEAKHGTIEARPGTVGSSGVVQWQYSGEGPGPIPRWGASIRTSPGTTITPGTTPRTPTTCSP